jgi:DNA invertase Pin-like site-specific DNA recombinase
MSEIPQAVLFIRVRHVGPDEQAAVEMQIAAQRTAGQQAAKKLNAKIVREYIERGGTDHLERRPIVRQMLAELGQARDAAYVIAYGGDRLARRGFDFIEIDDAIAAAGAELVFAREALTPSYDQYPSKLRRDVRRVFAVLADQR